LLTAWQVDEFLCGNVWERATYQAYGYPDMFASCDFDHNNAVDWADYGIFAAAYMSDEDNSSYIWQVDLNNDGSVDWADYGIFTVQYLWDVPDDFVSAYGNPYGFTGRRVDRLDGKDDTDGVMLNFHRNRYLNMTHGRWLSRKVKCVIHQFQASVVASWIAASPVWPSRALRMAWACI